MWREVARYLKALWKHWVPLVSGVGSVILSAINAYLKTPLPYSAFWVLALICFFVASFRAWRDAQLKPYDDDHKRIAEAKIRSMTTTGRDLLRFLLHRGRVEDAAVGAACQVASHLGPQAVGEVTRLGLVLRTEEPIPGRAGVRTFYEINGQFALVLRDLLFPRKEADSQIHFQP